MICRGSWLEWRMLFFFVFPFPFPLILVGDLMFWMIGGVCLANQGIREAGGSATAAPVRLLVQFPEIG